MKGRRAKMLMVSCGVTLLVGNLTSSCSRERESRARISDQDAMRAVVLAERFIARNGYTMATAKPPIEHESLEYAQTDSEILASRRGTLNPKAYGYHRSDTGWVVIFRHARLAPGDSSGRAVTVTNTGRVLRVEHQDIMLTSAEVVLDR